ncbi:MAG: alpha/beta hydrolase [Xanthobacteraceae bacterium]|nr:alpha/beta hydrolase [Xanthobacteraceae bacterium]MBV9235949.1 alpha/beta hydrolase [Xanthobacteraceae bacterium]MBV9628898.1 alpha/beta hydrolase [Xanthobacteraceae bacterium]
MAGSLMAVSGAEHTAYGPELEGFTYPYEVHRFEFKSQRQNIAMAYTDVAPSAPNGRTAVLLHGANFCAATWGETIEVLRQAGYRVIAPDQIGFCKSSKPESYQFTLQQLATNTNELLTSLGIRRATVVGHSMGGMLAMRYALMFPDAVEQLVLVDPLGLEDWQAQGVPFIPLDQSYQAEMRTSFDSIKQYQQKFYYAGEWKPEYDRWVDMLGGMYAGPGTDVVAWSRARLAEMIFTQPVVYELEHIRPPTLLLIGQKDRTAPGATRAPSEVAGKLGNYPALGRAAAKRIPHATLVEFPELGHAPQIQAPAQFHEALLKGLAALAR